MTKNTPRLVAWLTLTCLLSLRSFAQTAWRSEDIGSVGVSGTSSDSGGVVQLVGAGADIWDDADGFHFRHQPFTGDGELVARVTSLQNTHPWAKVGVMIRETNLAGSRHAFMCVTPGNGTAFQSRSTTGGSSASSAASGYATLPVWLKLVRAGATLTGFTSLNGTTWTQAGTVNLSGLSSTVLAGIAVTSHDWAVQCTAQVDSIAFNAGPPVGPTAPGAPVITPKPSESINSGYLYTYQINASNAPTSYSASGLPAGLTLNPSTGEIRGVCGGNGGTYTVTLRATNAAGTGAATQTMVVSGGGPIEMPWIQSVSVPADGTYRVGDTLTFMVHAKAYYSDVFVTGRPRFAFTLGSNTRYAEFAWGSGQPIHAYTYTVAPDDVGAAGLRTSDTIDLNGGTMQDIWPLWCSLNMTPVAGNGVRCEASSSYPSAAPALTTPDSAVGRYLQPLSFRITATNSPTSYGMTLPATPTRPVGLSINASTGEITGAPQASGTYVLTLRATNSVGTGTKALTLSIPHVISRLELPAAGTYRAGDVLKLRVTFSNPVRIAGSPSIGISIGSEARSAAYAFGSGQTHEFRYVVQSGDVDLDGYLGLAPGISLNGGTIQDAETGETFGISFARNTFITGVIVDAPGTAAPAITSATSASTTIGAAFTFGITATNSPTSYNASGLPPGLTVNTSTGVISGTPTTSGTFNVLVAATNAGGTGYGSLNLHVSDGGAVPWQPRDIGGVAAAGSSSESGGVVTVRGSGADIWDNSDEFHFRYQQLNGDGEIVARITSLTDTHSWAKAGLMIRESLDPGARHAFLCMSAGNGTALQWRTTQDGTTQSMHGSDTTSFPRWLRLKRTGNDINTYTSHDGVNWTQSRGVGIGALSTTMLVGLAVTSHNDGTVATATFDNLRISGAPPPAPGLPAAPENLFLYVESAKQIDLSWIDRATNESGFEIERSTDNASFARVGTTASNITSFSDTGVQPSTTYYYRVRAVNAQGVSAFTPVKSATTPAAPPPASTWEFGDIGHVGLAGSNSSSGNTITVNGAGHDIWENADGFRFVYRQLTGNGIVEAQVTSLTNTNPWAKAGVMIRHTLAPEARNVFVFATPNNGIAAQARTTSGGTTTFTPGPWTNAPHWVRLVRTANRITAYASPDAIVWTEIAGYDVEMAMTVYVGFAVTSHDKTQLNTAVFTDPFVE